MKNYLAWDNVNPHVVLEVRLYEGGLKISDLTKIQDIFSEFFLIFNIVSLLVTLHTSPSEYFHLCNPSKY